mmetsp:Transcript_32397/g.94832  ORF Transcript_32397/g.94832 Transcript_32397/m.94832 type:complete len:509 (-) Transcript_32397:1710-3236(-)
MHARHGERLASWRPAASWGPSRCGKAGVPKTGRASPTQVKRSNKTKTRATPATDVTVGCAAVCDAQRIRPPRGRRAEIRKHELAPDGCAWQATAKSCGGLRARLRRSSLLRDTLRKCCPCTSLLNSGGITGLLRQGGLLLSHIGRDNLIVDRSDTRLELLRWSTFLVALLRRRGLFLGLFDGRGLFLAHLVRSTFLRSLRCYGILPKLLGASLTCPTRERNLLRHLLRWRGLFLHRIRRCKLILCSMLLGRGLAVGLSRRHGPFVGDLRWGGRILLLLAILQRGRPFLGVLGIFRGLCSFSGRRVLLGLLRWRGLLLPLIRWGDLVLCPLNLQRGCFAMRLFCWLGLSAGDAHVGLCLDLRCRRRLRVALLRWCQCLRGLARRFGFGSCVSGKRGILLGLVPRPVLYLGLIRRCSLVLSLLRRCGHNDRRNLLLLCGRLLINGYRWSNFLVRHRGGRNLLLLVGLFRGQRVALGHTLILKWHLLRCLLRWGGNLWCLVLCKFSVRGWP